MNKSIEIIITGRVQGVGFRYNTRNVAIELNIKGFVRNLDDGSVYINAFGGKDEIESFVNWCKQGPRFAKVESFKVKEIEYLEFKEFSIR